MTLGTGTEQTTFTDSNISGTATILHTGVGDTSFAINTSAANAAALNSWGSLSITNGTGADQNIITDTHFTGNVTINNGAGDGTTDEFGGSKNLFSDGNNANPMTIGGNLYITTLTGQTDTEVYDYNVHGTLTIGAGAGVLNQTIENFVGVEDNHTTAGSAVPTFGSVSITGGAPAGLNPGLAVFVGTDPVGADFPLQVTGNFSINATGGAGTSPTVTGSVGVIPERHERRRHRHRDHGRQFTTTTNRRHHHRPRRSGHQHLRRLDHRLGRHRQQYGQSPDPNWHPRRPRRP